MICRTCLRAASRTHTQPTRFLTTSSRLRDATLQSTSIPPATSSSDAQPFSSPLTPSASPGIKAQATEAAKKKPTPLVKSSIAAGTPLKGLNFEKNKTDPVALPDDEYPEWLWTILQRQEKDAEGAGAGDLFCTFLYFYHYISLFLTRSERCMRGC
jgi:large subunit ribosomal protein L54